MIRTREQSRGEFSIVGVTASTMEVECLVTGVGDVVAAGAMVDRPSPHIHRTPLHVAAAAGHDRVVKVLLEGGADVDAKDSYHGSTPLHLCVGRNDIESGDEEESYLASANLLICFGGANLHAQTDEGLETPLDVATKAENESLVRLLLQHGADPNI